MQTSDESIRADVAFFNSYLAAINDQISNHNSKADFELLQTIAEKIYNFYNLKLNSYLFSFENLKTKHETVPLLTDPKEHDVSEVLELFKDIQALVKENQERLLQFDSYLQSHIQNISGSINELPTEIKSFIATNIIGTPLELPDEIWKNIFSYLTPQELTRMGLTSKSFNQFILGEGIGESFWKDAYQAFTAKNANVNSTEEKKLSSVADYKGFFKKVYEKKPKAFYLAVALAESSGINNEVVLVNNIRQQLLQGTLPHDCKLFDNFEKAAEFLEESYSFRHNIQNKKGIIIELQLPENEASKMKFDAVTVEKILEEKAIKIHADPRITSSSSNKVTPIKFANGKFVKDSDALATSTSVPRKK